MMILKLNRKKIKYEHLADDAITHGGIQHVMNPKLGIKVDGQTCIRYLRFNKSVHLNHVELGTN